MGDPKLGTQIKGAAAPAPPRATQHSLEPRGLGVTVTLNQEQFPGSPHTAQGHLGAAPGEETKGVLCAVARVGSRAECACLAMPDGHQCSLACFIIQFFSGPAGSSQTGVSTNEAAWEAGCVCVSQRETAGEAVRSRT